MAACLLRMGSPNNALVQVSNPQTIILSIKLEHNLIQAFGHVINGARFGWIKDFKALFLAL